MPCEQVFAVARGLLRPGGALAVIANGTPLWLQPSDWSQALRAVLQRWLGIRLDSCCGTDPSSRQRYRAALAEAGFTGFCEETADYTCGCREPHPRHATRRYSLIRPPTRACLRIRCCPRSIGPGSGFSGAAPSSDL
jgi:hypothetical protein